MRLAEISTPASSRRPALACGKLLRFAPAQTLRSRTFGETVSRGERPIRPARGEKIPPAAGTETTRLRVLDVPPNRLQNDRLRIRLDRTRAPAIGTLMRELFADRIGPSLQHHSCQLPRDLIADFSRQLFDLHQSPRRFEPLTLFLRQLPGKRQNFSPQPIFHDQLSQSCPV